MSLPGPPGTALSPFKQNSNAYVSKTADTSMHSGSDGLQLLA
jgi:hypothetical protein